MTGDYPSRFSLDVDVRFPAPISWMDVYRLTNSPPKINVGYLFSNIMIGTDDCVADDRIRMSTRRWRALRRRVRRRRPSRGARIHARRIKAEKRRKEG